MIWLGFCRLGRAGENEKTGEWLLRSRACCPEFPFSVERRTEGRTPFGEVSRYPVVRDVALELGTGECVIGGIALVGSFAVRSGKDS